MYHPARRFAAFLGVGAVLGVPSYLYLGQFRYDAQSVLVLASGYGLVAVMVAFVIFAAKPSSNNVPMSVLNALRLVTTFTAVLFVGALMLLAAAVSLPAPSASQLEQEAAATKYTNRVDVNGCKPRVKTAREVEGLTISNASDTCTVVLPLTRYSVVVVPDNMTVTLRTVKVDMSKATVKLVFPADSLVYVFVYDRTDTAHMAVRPVWAQPGGLPQTTVFSTRHTS